ncbi:hypothetical protein [Nitrosopumilus adriaticus]|uniref:Uncharacterized protein n=1 Tax=Nitrosopumilus adriaticus TaxID=1580092 RepID=A0A0D5C3T4_9ARCH|nr:hypothetical protein [Nitrosopumilus adriaticus]AJW71005.1 hypothetical protein NADRNF5_1319 [Nitrosopumilus adriaticus]
MNNVKILNKLSLPGFKQIEDKKSGSMGITSASEYVDFFVNLNMGENVSLLSFINNEKTVLKKNLDLKNIDKEPIKKGIEILELLVKEINDIGEKAVLGKYHK